IIIFFTVCNETGCCNHCDYIFILVLIILSRSSSIQAAGSFITRKRKHSLSVARVKNHHEFVITEIQRLINSEEDHLNLGER
ncbi:unnamed protein product, partial [Brassica napus]